jgi:integrase
MHGFAGTFPPEMPRREGTKTRHPGVYRLGPSSFRVRVKVQGPDGKSKQAERIVDGTLEEAVAARVALSGGLKSVGRAGASVLPMRPTVSDFAKFWLESKAGSLEEGTLDRYADVLEFHILPFMGGTRIDEVRAADVQSFINAQSAKKATPMTVRSRFAVLRSMMLDAVNMLDLPRDPTMRPMLPELDDRDEGNRLTPGQLDAWLAKFQELAPTQYAYALTLAFTGMRPCHVRALRWEDVDLEAAVLRPRMKVYLGVLSPTSKKKRAPKEFPMPAELVEALRAHKAWLNAPMVDYHLGPCLRHPGVASGLCFPNSKGKPQCQSKVWRVWQRTNEALGVDLNARGLRRTFNDMLRRAKVDAFTAEALTAQTPQTRRLYSTVDLDEKRVAVGKVLELVRTGVRTSAAGERGSDEEG